MKKHAPATERNRKAIADILAKELPSSGVVLEVASGSGEHAVYFAERFPQLDWQPSDFEKEALASIIAWQDDRELSNLRFPTVIDASKPAAWEVKNADAILCSNMVHITSWQATEGLFAGAAQILGGKDLPLILYGPFFEQGIEPAPSNLQFDAGLRDRNPSWGIRSAEELDRLALSHGFTRSARHEMPANNLMLVYRRS
ncbi:DUF938 domain-containing protein [Erythrobacter crassostreae]|uniref:DUF938 domain-containing protein n=1 Tax=Erythrobacter crassostreae TaxID=2828328 RepID=A0A9X1F365_9SPHN|nr:DUF938 domain-containing protein [Erythrobacter crassostrea]MBV7259471.1 DUF938 domain-containing protein [Erythrobacter crassostrea]